jgi:hypothetical protein
MKLILLTTLLASLSVSAIPTALAPNTTLHGGHERACDRMCAQSAQMLDCVASFPGLNGVCR